MASDGHSANYLFRTGHRIPEKMDDIEALLPCSYRIRPEDFNIEYVIQYMDALEQGPVRLILELEELLKKQKSDDEPKETEG